MYVAPIIFGMGITPRTWALKNMQCSGLGFWGISFVGYGGRTEVRLSYDYVELFLRSDALYYGMIPVLLLRDGIHRSRSWSLFIAKRIICPIDLIVIAVNCMFEAFWVRRLIIFLCLLIAALPVIEFESKKKSTTRELLVVKNYLYNLSYQLFVIVCSHYYTYITQGFLINDLGFSTQ